MTETARKMGVKADIESLQAELASLNHQLSKNSAYIFNLRTHLQKLNDKLTNRENEAVSCFDVDLKKLQEQFERAYIYQKSLLRNLNGRLSGLANEQLTIQETLRHAHNKIQKLEEAMGYTTV